MVILKHFSLFTRMTTLGCSIKEFGPVIHPRVGELEMKSSDFGGRTCNGEKASGAKSEREWRENDALCVIYNSLNLECHVYLYNSLE